MKRFILSIDQGTTSSRVILYDKNLSVIDSLNKEFNQFFPKDGWVEHRATEIWNDVKELIKKLLNKGGANIDFVGSLNRKETIAYVQRAKVGVLINSSTSIHSLKYTSPLKYFEYLYADLNVVAVDFESHHELPESKNIYIYKDDVIV